MMRIRLQREVLILVTVGLLTVSCAEAQRRNLTLVDIGAPGPAEVRSGVEHFAITVKGVLDRARYKLPADRDLLAYKVHIVVHPLAAEGWWPQPGAMARNNWEAHAFLGGTGQYAAKDGERFEIVAVLAKGQLGTKYNGLQSLLKESGVVRISEVKTVVTRRP